MIECSTDSVLEHIDIPKPVANMSNSSETYVNSQNNMIYALLRSILADGNGVSHELDSLYVFDSNTKNLVRVLNPRWG